MAIVDRLNCNVFVVRVQLQSAGSDEKLYKVNERRVGQKNNCDPFLIACVSIFSSVVTEFFPTNRITFLDANTIVKSDFPYHFDLLSFSSQGNGFDIDHLSCQQRAQHVSPFVRKKIILCLTNKILKSQFLSSKPLI